MSDDPLIQRALALRAEGVTPKQIARTLGVRPAQVSEWIRTALARDAPRDDLGALIGAWVNPGWSQGLGLEGAAEAWRALDPAPDSGHGLVTVFLERAHRYGKVRSAWLLVDPWCLGVKNATGPRALEAAESAAFRARLYERHACAPVSIPLALAQALVLGAEQYARSLGFSAHPDFDRVRPFLGPWDGPSPIRFGNEGRPEFVAGPQDDPGKIREKLDRAVGPGNYHFTHPAF